MKKRYGLSRRLFLQSILLGAGGIMAPKLLADSSGSMMTRKIPSTGERVPVIGLGTSRTFNVGNDPVALDNVAEVMRYFFAGGGKLIDTSPMYGSSQPAIGYGLSKLKTEAVFAADKVWSWNPEQGPEQMEQSRQYWGVDVIDLMQVHNLVEWDEHLKTLYRMKEQGRIRYIGITTSHGRRHDDLAALMKIRKLDFVQLSYNILDREAEQTLLPLAKKLGIGVIVNRPFQRGDLIEELEGKPLPAWSSDINCTSWPQFLLKFIVSHPAVTVAIPATTQVAHVKENMLAGYGAMPDARMRHRMIDYVEKIL